MSEVHKTGHGPDAGLPERADRNDHQPISPTDLSRHLCRQYESSPDGILIIELATGKVADGNPRFYALTGLSADRVRGRRVEEIDLFDPDEVQGGFLETAVPPGDRAGRPLGLRNAAGGTTEVDLFAHSYELDSRSFLRCIFRESPASPREMGLDDEREPSFHAGFYDSLPFGCQIVDTEWRCVFINKAAAEFHARYSGRPASSLVGRTIGECQPGIENTPVYAAIAESMNNRVRTHFEGEVELVDGSKRTFEYIVFPVALGVFVVSIDLTERKKTEETKASLAAIVESADQAIVGKSLDGTITSWNRGAEHLYGYTKAEAIGRPVSILIPPGHDNELPVILEQVRRGERVAPYETVRMRKDGSTVEVHLSVSPVADANGEVVGASAFVLDISERKRAEREAKESSARFEMIENTIENVVWIFDPVDWRVVYTSPAFEQIWGRPRSEVYARPGVFLDPIHPDDRERVERDTHAHVKERSFTHDFRVYRTDGSLRWINNRGYPLLDERGEVVRVVVISTDITERKAAEERFEEQARLLDVTSDLIVVGDTENRIRYCNRNAELAFGQSLDEVAGRDVFEVARPLMSAERLQEIVGIVYSVGEWSGDLSYTPPAGGKKTMLTRLTLMRDGEGEPNAVLAVSTDVTETRSIERQLMRTQRLESLGSLAGGIAHDLNNVLAPILMGTESLSVRNHDESTRTIVDIIRTSAERGAGIVRQILGFARGVEGERTPIQLRHLIREVESIITETFPKNIDARFEIPKDLRFVVGDSTQIHQVVMNICVNARDAMPSGGQLTVSACNQELDEAYARMHVEAKAIPYVVLEISDTGRGMPADVLEKIFDPFFTTKAAGKGTGLGLSTARTIVGSHGGFINAYSEPGKGTSFKVYLPASRETGNEPGEVSEGIPMGNGELVLVADDEQAVREISREILESYGYRVVTASDGTDALVAYLREQQEVRVAVIDMMMPHLDGTATIRALRKINPLLPVIATSGLLSNEQAIDVRGLGASAFLLKPYTAATLLKTLSDALPAGGTAPYGEA